MSSGRRSLKSVNRSGAWQRGPRSRKACSWVMFFVLGIGGFLTGAALIDSVSPTESYAAPTVPEPAPTPAERTSPVAVLAQGTEKGEEWSFRAYTAIGRDANTSGKSALCLEWKYASTSEADDFNCLVNDSGVFEGPVISYFSRVTQDPPESSFFGPVMRGTDRVDITLADETLIPAQVFRAPAELGSSEVFFAGFAPPHTDVVITGYDVAGEVIWSRALKE
jgi:hypothetical protein